MTTKDKLKRKADSHDEESNKRTKKPAVVLPAFLVGDDDESSLLPRGRSAVSVAPVLSSKPEEDKGLFVSKREKKSIDEDSSDDEVEEKKSIIDGYAPTIEKDATQVHTLSIGKLSIGSVMLGSVKSIADLDMVISLPDGLTGFVSLRELSDTMAKVVDDYIANGEKMNDDKDDEDDEAASTGLPDLNEMYKIGDLVRVVVVKLSQTHTKKGKASVRVELSMRPSLVNTHIAVQHLKKNFALAAAVQSVEEKGYILDIGIPNRTAFLAKGETKYALGQTIDVALTHNPAADTRVVAVTNVLDTNKCVLNVNSELPLEALKPGTLLKTLVLNTLQDGIVLRFLGSHTGTVSLAHLASPVLTSVFALDNEYAINTSHIARVLYVNPLTKVIMLTLRPDLVKENRGFPFPAWLQVGQILKNARVIRTVRDTGAVLELTEALQSVKPADGALEGKTIAWLHSKDCADEKLTALPKFVKANKYIKVRVTGFNPLEGQVVVSARPSVLSAEVFRVEDVVPGKLYSCEVASFKDKVGLLVKLTPSITGLVPLSHLRDGGYATSYSKILEKYADGTKHSFRVLSTNAKDRRVILTAKPSLVKSTLCTLASAAQAAALLAESSEGVLTDAVVAKVSETGVTVSFYSDLVGFCSVGDMIKAGTIVEGQSLSTAYEVGQVVRVRVTRVKGTKVVFSFQTTGTAPVRAEKRYGLRCGTWVTAKVTGILADKSGLSVTLSTGSKTYEAVLPVHHLSDSTTNAQALLATHAEVETEFPHALVLSKHNDKFIVSVKPMLLAFAAKLDITGFLATLTSANLSDFNALFNNALRAAGVTVGAVAEVPTSAQDLSVGDIVVGGVSNVSNAGVFLRSVGGLTYLAPTSAISDAFVSDAKELFRVGQTVVASITAIDTTGETARIVASLQPSVVGSKAPSYDSMYVAVFFAEQTYLAANDIVARDAVEGDECTYVPPSVAVGAILPEAKVTKVNGSIIFFSAPKTSATLQVANAYHTAGSSIAEGAVKGAVSAARVIDVDPATGIAALCLRPAVVDSLDTVSKKKGTILAASAASAASLKSGAVVEVEVLHVNRNYVVVGLVDYKYSLAIALPNTSNKARVDTSFLVPGFRTTATVVCPPSSTADRLVVALNLGVRAKKNRILPDGTFYSVSSLSEFKPNTTVKVKVGDYDPKLNAITVMFGPDNKFSSLVSGRLSLSSVIDPVAPPKPSRNKTVTLQSAILEAKKLANTDELVEAKIIKSYLANQMVSFPGTVKSIKQRVVEVSVRPTDVLDDAYLTRANLDDYIVGSTHPAAVLSISNSGIIAEFSPGVCATIRPTAVTADKDLVASVTDYIKIGDVIRVKITANNATSGVKTSKRYIHAALVHNKLNPTGVDTNTDYSGAGEVKVGGIVENVVVRGYDSKHCTYNVSLGGSAIGRLNLAELNDIFQENAKDIFKTGDIIPYVAVLAFIGNDEHQKRYIVSARESRIAAALKGELDVPVGVYDPKGAQEAGRIDNFDPMQVTDVLGFKDLASGQLLHGYVAAIDKFGVFVQLSGLLMGRVMLKELSESFITDASLLFKQGQLLPVRVLKINPQTATIELTAKRSAVSAANLRMMELLKPGMVVKGKVHKVSELGVFITLKHCTLRGLSYKTECVDNKSVDYAAYYSVGDKVKAVVLRVDKAKQKISLGLKASLFQKLDEIAAKGRSHTDALTEMVDEDEDAVADVKPSEGESSSEDEFEDDVVAARTVAVAPKRKVVDIEIESAPSLFSSLVSPAPAQQIEEEEELVPMDGDEDVDELSRKAAKDRREREIERTERAIMDEAKPQSAEEHEMSCIRYPNNSYVWIQYMAYELGQGNIAKARDVAERALKTISVHEMQEHWNIWSAMLSLENVYGTIDSISDVVKRAQKMNDPLTVQLELARIYDMSNKVDRADDAYNTAAKRWGADYNDRAVDIWNNWSTMLFKYGRVEEARKVLGQAIQKLNAKHHAPVLVKFAQLEFQSEYGAPDRARMLLEKFLSAHPKRLDIWMIYVDQETKFARALAAKVNGKPGDVKKAKSRVRTLLDRVTAETQWKVWTTKQMKFIFKKYIDFEEEMGTSDRVSIVQDKARLYIASVTAE